MNFKKLILAIALVSMAIGVQAQTVGKTARYCNPLPMEVGDGGQASGDVSVFQWNGKYYMFCTGGGCWVSEDMLNWDYHYVANVPVAPDVVPYNGKFYMTGNSVKTFPALKVDGACLSIPISTSTKTTSLIYSGLEWLSAESIPSSSILKTSMNS